MSLVKIAIMALQEAKDLQRYCLENEIEIFLNHNEKTCTRGCTVTVEVHANENDLENIQSIYSKQYQKSLDGLMFDPEIINSVFDPSAEFVTCPACGHIFPPTHLECPDCGLSF